MGGTLHRPGDEEGRGCVDVEETFVRLQAERCDVKLILEQLDDE